MAKQNPKSHFTAKRFILLVCLLALLLSAGWMSLHAEKTNQLPAAKSVGSVRPVGRDVRVKGHADELWNPVAKDSNVFKNDRIYTGKNSQAEVDLKSHQKLTIEPDSVVEITEEGKNNVVEFKSGSAVAKLEKDSKLFVKIGEREAEISSASDAQIRMAHAANGNVKLSVLRGEAELKRSENPLTEKLPADSVISLGEKTSKAEVSTISLISPMPGEKVWTKTNSVRFVWSRVESSQLVKIQISSTPDFQKIDKEISSDRNSILLQLEGGGSYFWRVVNVKNPTDKSLVSSFTIQELIAPKVAAVSDVTDKTGADGKSLNKVNFEWDDSLASDEYVIELSNDKNFRSVMASQHSKTTAATISHLPAGHYFWRVTSLGEGRDNLVSNTGDFRFHEAAKPVATSGPKSESSGREPTSVETPVLEATPDADSGTRTVKPLSAFKPPEFWLWAGGGMDYQYYQQTIPSIKGTGTFQNIQGPVLSTRVGFQGEFWGFDASYRDTPGKMESKASTTVTNGNYHWRTLEAEGLYRLNPNFNLRFGFQNHTMPFMAFDSSTLILDVKSNTLNMATIGFDRKVMVSPKLRGELMMRYQQPVNSGTADGTPFDVSSKLAFDGSVGGVYSATEHARLGVYWYGQYHQYGFTYGSGAGQFSGNQTLFYSSVEFRLGLEY